MRAVDIIHKKREGHELTAEEIRFLIQGYSSGEVPDYQIAAWAMAVYFQGMTASETASLTLEMARSGDQIDLSSISGIKVDKHSTGGVGDKTSLILAPLVAAAGVPVAKMSGRGLGHTGGTIDKLESIPGFRVELEREQFFKQVNEIGVSLIGQTGNITPADKKLYALRDVTATVESIPLIASSVMSKKIAAGADAIVLDVKTGSGAFMKTLDDSIALAQAMVDIGTDTGRHTIAVISDMDQPLGRLIGNSLEVEEAIQTLRGEGPRDLYRLCIVLGSHMLVLGGIARDATEAEARLEQLIADGSALEKLKELIAAQGGDASVVDHPERLPHARERFEVKAEAGGTVSAIQAEEIGIAAMLLGAGRETKDSVIDLSVGIDLRAKVGDAVNAGDVLAVLHVNDASRLQEAAQKIIQAYRITSEARAEAPLVYAIVTKDGVERFV
ncbi:pyrimidine-nucleoside phosphorylase [Paenibacillus dendritiformis]|uniref:pyrimidine-nucleoside phosphorylase n=1 Tax=Paenibacillus dendritiformis TaxID=130049 RepID=UPI00143D76C4|nr:pyrimidine-nucleoside phosphorylase [Paenibacillus dendritiformis]NKI19842.1 pyrimidine-nucleoside phosphorylase [Paenibacillus dendritiformis]NRF99960.1 pyrimidine-nucleoside phosphorylase [Paenibacillus dendritiformis]GIO70815.1 pyrimidine-nucleoside phosphorylase [Paenibacillus dendritiformis]